MVRIRRWAAVAAVGFLAVAGGAVAAATVQDGGTAPGAGTVDLAPVFRAEAEHTFDVGSVVVMYQKTPQGEVTETKTSRTRMLRRTGTVKDGAATFDVIIKAYREKSESRFYSVEFDSEQPADKDGANPVAARYRPLIDAAIGIDTDMSGTITNIRLSPALAAAGMTDRKMVQTQMQGLFNIKEPPHAVALGEKWTKSASEDSAFADVTYTTEYSVERVEDGVAIIPFSTTVEFKPKPDFTGPAPEVKSTSMTGTVRWNVADGALDRLEMIQKIELVLPVGEVRREETKTITRVR